MGFETPSSIPSVFPHGTPPLTRDFPSGPAAPLDPLFEIWDSTLRERPPLLQIDSALVRKTPNFLLWSPRFFFLPPPPQAKALPLVSTNLVWVLPFTLLLFLWERLSNTVPGRFFSACFPSREGLFRPKVRFPLDAHAGSSGRRMELAFEGILA